MRRTVGQALYSNFLGTSPTWYKFTLLGFLMLNPILLYLTGPFVAGWVVIVEFIFTLAMALKCYPLPAGGLLAIQAVILGLTTPKTVYDEINVNLPVILLLMFMVAGIYFVKQLLQYLFTRILLWVWSRTILSLLFCLTGAFLSAILDALTVTAVVISVAYGFYDLYHRFASGNMDYPRAHDNRMDGDVQEGHRADLKTFRGFLRNLVWRHSFACPMVKWRPWLCLTRSPCQALRCWPRGSGLSPLPPVCALEINR
jgi:Na+:H+ antiporter, NhaB family